MKASFWKHVPVLLLVAAAGGCGAGFRPLDATTYAIRGNRGVSNQLVLNTAYGPVVIDARLDPYLTDDMNRKALDATGWKDVAYVINTSGLPYRWLTNYRYPRAEIIASERTHRFMAEHGAGFLQKMLSGGKLPAWADEIRPVLPTMNFDGRLTLRTPDMCVIIMEKRTSVCPGNCVVYVPEKGLLYGGDIVTSGTAPILKYADPEGWLKSLDELRKLPIRTVIPGYGDTGGTSLIDDVTEAVKELRSYVGGPPGAAMIVLWYEDADLEKKLKEYAEERKARP
ncbi:MAG: hypothetical protein JW909_02235 [Planctomycetes bacterium]|nr:hypothetical protein [Planctomycetota bacterium]